MKTLGWVLLLCGCWPWLAAEAAPRRGARPPIKPVATAPAAPAPTSAEPAAPAAAPAPAVAPVEPAAHAVAPPVELAPAPAPAGLEAPPQESPEMAARMAELEDLVAELERKNALQRLSWSADYRVTLSHFRVSGDAIDGSRDASGLPRREVLRNSEQWTHRARLMLQADPIPQLRFRARLVAFKRFGDSVASPSVDGSTARVPRDATARLDRFWVDWFITDKLSVSLGRLSTTDGSPSELRENLDRPAATVSIGLVDSEYDIAAFTYQLGPALLRGFYLSWQFQRQDDALAQLPFLATEATPTRIVGAGVQVRSETRAIPTFELSGYYNPRFRPVPPYVLPLSSGQLVPASRVPSSLGELAGGTLLLMWRALLPGLDVFVSGSASYARGNDQAVEFPVGPEGLSVPVLTLSGADSSTRWGTHAYAGVRVTVPVCGARAPKLGAEVTYGSRYLVTFTTPTTDLLTRLGVRGRTFDVYAIQPIYPQLFARLSWTLIDYAYASPIAGALGPVSALGGTAPALDRTVQGFNLMLNATF